MSKEDGGLKSIKQTIEYEEEGGSGGEPAAWARRAVELLETGNELRSQIGAKSDEKSGKDGTGLLGRLSSIEDELRLIIQEHNLEGVRYNNTVFRCTAQSGRVTMDYDVFKKELVMRDVDIKAIREAEAAAQKVGAASWRKEWREVKA